MPRNLFGGNKAKRGKNRPRRDTGNKSIRIKEEELELYGKVIARAGGAPPILDVMCEDGKQRRCVVRGKFAKKVWMNKDDIILITCSDESGESGEVTCKYNPSEVSRLEQLGEIKSTTFGGSENNEFITFTTDVQTDQVVDDYYANLSTDLSGNTTGTGTVTVFDQDITEQDENNSDSMDENKSIDSIDIDFI